MDRSSRLAWLVLPVPPPVLHLESFPLMNREDDLSHLDSQTRLDNRSLIYPFTRARSFASSLDSNLTGGQPAAMYEL